MKKTKTLLQDFYNQQADQFHQTRKKHRSEFDIIADHINQHHHDNKNIKICELWCGDGRFQRYFLSTTNKTIQYTGVDFSRKLIDIAKNNDPHQKRVCQDMMDFLQKTKVESFDCIIAIDSVQHLTHESEREKFREYCYQRLNYSGLFIMINRSYSRRFINKYKTKILKSLLKCFLTGGRFKRNDVQIPWKTKTHIYQRYYHMFTHEELIQLSQTTSFKTILCEYVSSEGHITKKWQSARNTIYIWKKSIT